ncbi:MAG: polysaccharide deacetylase family protein [Desulfobacterales bacterium]
MAKPANRRKTVFGRLFPLYLLLLAACAPSQARIYDDFIIVKATAVDTLPSLAHKYLNDPTKDWLISEFNDIKTLDAGQEFIIPLRPFDKGGLKVNGYQTVPVLAYHGFSKDSPGKMTVTEASFEAQMKYLMENGYHVISLDQLMDFLEFKEQIPEKSVVITIDNGLSSFSDIAFPILKKFGFTATLFIYTDFIGNSKALSWEQINNLSKKGFDIQCKTKTHRNLTKRKKKESFKDYFKSLEMEISYSKKLFKQKLNKECSYFAYPYGATNNLVVAILIKQGYRAAFTVKRASNPCFVDRYRIHRSVIYGDYDIERFKKNLSVFNKIKLK